MDFKKLKAVAEQYAAKTGTKVSGAVDKGLTALAAPQKYVTRKLTEAAGLKDAGTNEANVVQLVDKGAEALGLAPDSVAGNVLKAGAVAAGEVLGDPLGFIPLGKIAKGMKGLKNLSNMQSLGKIAEEAKVLQLSGKQRAKSLAEIAEHLKGRDMQLVTKESSQATDTYKKLMDAKKAQEAAPVQNLKPEPPPKSKVQLGNDMALANEAVKVARTTGVPPEREAAFVQLYLRSRGVK